MNYFKYNQMKLEEEKLNKEGSPKLLYVDILPKKSCIYQCIFCPRKRYSQATSYDFGDLTDSLASLTEKIHEEKPDIVYLYGTGDPITNSRIDEIIEHVHKLGLPVRTIVNGAMLGAEYHMREANMCDEIAGCLGVLTEEDFQRIHQPLPELSLAYKNQAVIDFSRQYKGIFTLRVVLLKGCNDSDEQVAELKKIVDQVDYDILSVATRPTGLMGDAFAVSPERVAEITKILEEGHVPSAFRAERKKQQVQ